MDGYESTDGELDTDNEDEHELSRWLKQLDEPVEVLYIVLLLSSYCLLVDFVFA
jgi:hypothetical protein